MFTHPLVKAMAAESSAIVAVGTSTPQKRRASRTQGDHAIDTIFDVTGQSDLRYIMTTLQQDKQLIPFLASWIRDGVIQRALQRQQFSGPALWPISCFKQRQMGAKYLKRVTAMWEPSLFGEWDEQARDEESCLTSVKHASLLHLFTFATGTKDLTWLPSTSVEESIKVFTAQYELLGSRLAGMKYTTTWDDHGYFVRDPTIRNKIIFNVDLLTPKRSFTLPYSIEFMAAYDDWCMTENWSLDASLMSVKAGISQKLLPLLKLAFGDRDYLFWELESYEPDGRSVPLVFNKKRGSGDDVPSASKPAAKAKAKGKQPAQMPPRPIKRPRIEPPLGEETLPPTGTGDAPAAALPLDA